MLNPAIPSDANALLSAHGLRPRKRWGQNFLCDQNVLNRIAGAAALKSGDHVLEIGPGLGGLTRTLASQCESITAVEIDPLMEPILRETLADFKNVHLIIADFLKLDTDALLNDTASSDRCRKWLFATPFILQPGVKVVANIPYYITTPIIEQLLDHKGKIAVIVLLVQQEVAERMVAKPGTERYGSLSVFVQFHSKADIVGKVSRSVFVPPPEVGSAIIRLMPESGGTVKVNDEETFFKIVRAAFGQRRKTIANALSGGDLKLDRDAAHCLLQRAGIDPQRRGETLSVEEFAGLANSF